MKSIRATMLATAIMVALTGSALADPDERLGKLRFSHLLRSQGAG
jgi:hypothetical protein